MARRRMRIPMQGGPAAEALEDITSEDLKSIGLTSLGGGADLGFRDPTLIEDNQISDGSNMIVRQGRLMTRPALNMLLQPAGDTGRMFLRHVQFTGDVTAEKVRLIIHDKGKVWIWDGTSVTDKTGTALTLAGSDLAPWTSAVAFDNAGALNYFASDGLNQVIYWDGGAATTFHYMNGAGTGGAAISGWVGPGGSIVLKARYLMSFAGRLLLLYTTGEGAGGTTVCPQRVRWCDNGNASKWDVSAGRGAGAVDLAETPGEIVGSLVFGTGTALIFKQDAILGISETGNIRAPLAFPQVSQTGSLSGGSVASIGAEEAIFLGRDNVYRMAFGASPVPIGNAIRKHLFNNLDFDRRRLIASVADFDRCLYYLGIPMRGSGKDSAIILYCYNWLENVWSPPLWFASSEITSLVRTPLSVSGTLIDALTGTINSYSSTRIDSWGSAQKGYQVLAGGVYGTSDFRVFNFVDTRDSDQLSSPYSIASSFTTKNMRLNSSGYATVNALHLHLNVKTSSGNLSIEASIDRGSSWTQIASRSLSAGDFQHLHIPCDVTGAFHMFRFSTFCRIEVDFVDLEWSVRLPDFETE